MIRDVEEPCCDCPICSLLKRPGVGEAVRHLHNARREVLLAVKVLVEAGIERMEKKKPTCRQDAPARKVAVD